VSAAKQVVSFSGGCAADLLLKRFDSLIDASGRKKVFG
jgi:hypothetical protein